LRLPQPRGPEPRVYILQEQGGPVLPPGTGFPLRRLLRLAGTTVEVFHPASTRDLSSVISKAFFISCTCLFTSIVLILLLVQVDFREEVRQ
jgi:hypothetical protein